MSKTNVLAAFLSGAAAGAAVGLLLAPQSGEETRNKLIKAKDDASDSLDDLIEEGKKSWYQAKGKAETNAGIAADELDEFMRHIIGKGKKWWSKSKNRANEMADDAGNAVDDAIKNGKKTAAHVNEEGRRVMENAKERAS